MLFGSLIGWLENHMGTCFYQKFLGFPCPGCGMQRSLIELLKGNLWESLALYPALIPTIFLFVFLVLHLVFQFKNGANILRITFIGNIVIIVFHYIYVLLIR
jgi:hypothetical protein